MTSYINSPQHLLFLFQESNEQEYQADIKQLTSSSEERDSKIKNLITLLNFWDEVSNQSQITNDKIHETLVAVADYFDELFNRSSEILNITKLILRDQESLFFKSIKDFNDQNLIE